MAVVSAPSALDWAAVHAEVADVNQEVRQAKAQVSQAKAIGARTLRMAAGAIERRRAELRFGSWARGGLAHGDRRSSAGCQPASRISHGTPW